MFPGCFTAGLRTNKNNELIRSLYLTPPEDFDSTMRRAKDYMLVDEASNTPNDEEQEFLKKQQNKARAEEPPKLLPPMQRSSPPPSRCYTLLNSPRFEVLNYINEEGYIIQALPPIRSPHETRRNKDLYGRYHLTTGMVQRTVII